MRALGLIVMVTPWWQARAKFEKDFPPWKYVLNPLDCHKMHPLAEILEEVNAPFVDETILLTRTQWEWCKQHYPKYCKGGP